MAGCSDVHKSVHIQTTPAYLDQRGAEGLDYLEIQKIERITDLERWLNPATALRSSEVCTGSVGRRHPHQQIRRELPEEEALDFEYLQVLERCISIDNVCSRIVAGFER